MHYTMGFFPFEFWMQPIQHFFFFLENRLNWDAQKVEHLNHALEAGACHCVKKQLFIVYTNVHLFYCCCFLSPHFFSGQFSVVLNASRQVFTRRTFMERASFMKKRIKNNTDCIVKQQATKRASFQQAGPNEGITKQTWIVVVCTKQISLWELEKNGEFTMCIHRRPKFCYHWDFNRKNRHQANFTHENKNMSRQLGLGASCLHFNNTLGKHRITIRVDLTNQTEQYSTHADKSMICLWTQKRANENGNDNRRKKVYREPIKRNRHCNWYHLQIRLLFGSRHT